MSRSRQLAAIMFTDIVGYTKLMGEDEEKAFELLKKNRSVQRPIIERYNGRWLKEIGDGVLASFNAVSDAVYCAGAIQKACENEPDLKLRIGIHEGEVVFEGDDVFGDGVNIASRLEPLAPIGGILVSEAVHKNLLNKKGIESTFIREEQLKNVREPVKIYSVQVEGVEPVAIIKSLTDSQHLSLKSNKPKKIAFAASGALIILLLSYFLYSNLNTGTAPFETRAASLDKSIVVLPFTNLSSDPEQEYFSDGMMEEILNHLVKIKDLKVISRTTAMRYRGTGKSIQEIAEELGVATVLEGSVRKAGNQLRITVQLIDGGTDMHLWSETYDRNLDDVFAIQSNIAQNVAERLRVEITSDVKKSIEQVPTKNMVAYNLFIEARHIMRTGTTFEIAQEKLENAIALDSGFASAYAYLARYWINTLIYGTYKSLNADQAHQEIQALLKNALEIDENDFYANFQTAIYRLWFHWDFESAEYYFEKALENYTPEYGGLPAIPNFYLSTNRPKKAVEIMDMYIKNDPFQRFSYHSVISYVYNNQSEKGLKLAETAIELFGNNSLYGVIPVLNHTGNYQRVIDLFNEYGQNQEDRSFHFLAYTAIAYHHSNQDEITNSLLKEILQRSNQSAAGSPSYYAAMILADLGKVEASFELLEKAYLDREEEMYWLKVEPTFESLRSDSRWQQMLDKVGFPE